MTTFPFRNVVFESNEPTEITFQTADKQKLRWSQAKNGHFVRRNRTRFYICQQQFLILLIVDVLEASGRSSEFEQLRQKQH